VPSVGRRSEVRLPLKPGSTLNDVQMVDGVGEVPAA
jgi:hypothetical protein